MTDYTPRQWQPKEKLTDTLPPAPRQWQPKRKQNSEIKKFYTVRGGKVENYNFSDIAQLKRSKSEEIKIRKGKIFQIRKPESMVEKIKNPQTKLWYYDKRNYPNRKSLSDLTDQKPKIQLYSITKPDPNKKPPVDEVKDEKEEIIVEEKNEPVREPTPVKQPEPEPEPVPETKEEEPLVPKRDDAKALARSGVAAGLVLPPLIIPKSSVSHYTVNSIEKSMKYYRF